MSVRLSILFQIFQFVTLVCFISIVFLLRFWGGNDVILQAQMPKNPERPLEAQTCQSALVRVREAAEGSPLISEAQNKQQLLIAISQAERLCFDKLSKT